MPTPNQISWLRDDVGTNELGLPELEAIALFDRAEAASSSVDVQEALTRIYYIRSLWSNSARLASYRQNHTQENISDIFGHLQRLLEYWENKLEEAVNLEAGSVLGGARSGRQSKLPTRYTEYPNSA